MSLVAFKNTSVNRYATKHTGKGGIWISQGPFGKKAIASNVALFGPSGFSLNGAERNVGYIGKDYKMSTNGTPFRGAYPIGHGGTFNKYPYTQPVYNVNEVIVLGEQWMYVKPSVLSTKGMLAKRYKWIDYGTWPSYIFKENYGTSNLSNNKSQGLYLHVKTTKNMCVNDTNNDKKYVGFIKCYQPNLLGKSTAYFTYDNLAQNGPYGKQLHQSVPSSQQTLQIQKTCGNTPNLPPTTNGNNPCFL